MTNQKLRTVQRSILIVFLFSLKIVLLNAQEKNDILKSNVLEAPFIVEGEVIEKTSFRNSQNGEIMTANKLHVSTKIKGSAPDTIIIATVGGFLDGQTVTVSHGAKINLNEVGIFLLQNSTHNYFQLYNGNLGKVKRLFNDVKAEAYYEGNRKKYKSWRKLREQIGEWSGIDLSIPPITNKETLFTIENDPELCVQLANVIPDVLNSKIEFDLMVKSNVAGLPFASREILFDYPIAHLGANIVFNDKVEVTKEIVSADEDYIMTVEDINQDRMKIDFETGCLAGENYYILGTDFEKLAHVVLDVQNWGNQGTMYMDNLAGEAKYFLAEDGCLDFYDICYGGQVSFMTCNVTGVATSPYGAGIDQTITITGTNFGTTAGIGSKITVPNPDDGGDTDFDISGNFLINPNIITWQDTMIQMKLSSINSFNEAPVATGTWRIFPDITASDPNTLACNLDVEIDYALNNEIVDDMDKMIGIAQDTFVTTDGSYEWYIDSGIDTDPILIAKGITFAMVEQVAISAFCDWEMATGINFTYMGGYADADNDNDRKNVIFFTSDVDSLTGAETRRVTSSQICTGDPFFSGRFREADIKFNINFNWFISTSTTGIMDTEFDFYSILMHEIGHCLELEHSMDTDPTNGTNDNRMMYWRILDEQIRRGIDAKSLAGVSLLKDRTTASMNQCFDGFVFNVSPIGCTTPTIDFTLKEKCDVKISNHVRKGENILLLSNEDALAEVRLYDLQGRLLSYKKNIKTSEYNVYTQNYPSGMYVLSFTCNGQLFSEKIIIH